MPPFNRGDHPRSEPVAFGRGLGDTHAAYRLLYHTPPESSSSKRGLHSLPPTPSRRRPSVIFQRAQRRPRGGQPACYDSPVRYLPAITSGGPAGQLAAAGWKGCQDAIAATVALTFWPRGSPFWICPLFCARPCPLSKAQASASTPAFRHSLRVALIAT